MTLFYCNKPALAPKQLNSPWRSTHLWKTKNGGNFGQYISVPENLIEQYEARLTEKDEIIKLLKEK